MAPSLLHPPSQLSPAAALQLSQKAPTVLQSSPSTVSSSPLSALFTASETPDLWIKYENLLLSCLRTGDERAAHQCLERLVTRFGNDNERIMALKGLLKEADAQNNGELEKVLEEYDQILSDNATNIPIAKRRIALLRSMGRVSEAVSSLVQLLDFSPTDAEAWSELGDIYLSQGLYSQAIYALEEVLLLVPNAWNIHARLGEVQYMAATASGAGDVSSQKSLAEALKRFARSIELCDDYLRGYYGLKLVTTRILREPPNRTKQDDADDFVLPDTSTAERLHELATEKLSEIVRHYTLQDRGWRGYDESEIAAARDLLAKNAAGA
ncbi:hypothetical protein QBC46DRAFT_425056 [Diplogelasinospora grovesii]|uniref:ER membrane protein complex subunit 2 n=1 Tax=Diplogelasinospora grovesii TaxID=303347 RepID=A0AAN6NHN6_9PEZI|nr:hypothetical protein QBC46DRAFT_425056 [Diplogelasinospora grovesii]